MSSVKLQPGSSNPVVDRLHAPKTCWIRASEVILALVYVCVVVLAAVVIWQLAVRHSERHVIAWCVAAMAVGIALPLSFHSINLHLHHYHSPLQRYYIRILLLVPIYAVESWCALRFKDQAIYLETMREAYEAYTIHAFFALMRDYLGTDKAAIQARITALSERTGRTEAKMLFPFCYMRGWRLTTLMKRCELLCLQYVVLRLLFAIIILVCEHFGVYEEGSFSPKHLYLYSTIIVSASQFGAMYGLVLFYHELKDELKPLRPLRKFLSIKAVVFATFYQSVILSGLHAGGVLEATLTYSEDDIAKGIQDFAICLEMAIAAIAHHFVFSHRDFAGENDLTSSLVLEKRNVVSAVLDVMPLDLVRDAKEHMSGIRSGMAKRRSDSTSAGGTPSPATGAVVDLVPLSVMPAAATAPPS